MRVNGTHLPWPVAVVIGGMLLTAGGALVRGEITADSLKSHEAKPWHDQAGPVIAENRINNKAVRDRLESIEKRQDRLEAKQDATISLLQELLRRESQED